MPRRSATTRKSSRSISALAKSRPPQRDHPHERADARGAIAKRLVWRGPYPVRPVVSGGPRRGGSPDGAQRRRQVDHHQGDNGFDGAAVGYGAVLRRGYLEAAVVRNRTTRSGLCARGPAHFLRPDRAGKPRHRPPAPAAIPGWTGGTILDAGKAVRDISQSRDYAGSSWR